MKFKNVDEMLKETGSFFAFSNKQFDEQKKDGVEYVGVTAGLVTPKDRVKEVIEFLKG
jgi:4-hydroxy-3-methylbut-2-enyl diphosphate reductase IspH